MTTARLDRSKEYILARLRICAERVAQASMPGPTTDAALKDILGAAIRLAWVYSDEPLPTFVARLQRACDKLFHTDFDPDEGQR